MLSGDDCLFEAGFRAVNADDVVVDLYGLDDRSQIGLTERRFADRDLFAHERPESLEVVRFEHD
ncbi:hypothetical protein MSC49_32690 [Methylosinus sp. C49]|uniref:hypothetical protein n=1 Tax=Methylosinus sp. C49 TaxID=2699395 RepID=UPI001366D3E9|nr:hypothetical protein MSC49_32690 [Methylosinus sp. C49]